MDGISRFSGSRAMMPTKIDPDHAFIAVSKFFITLIKILILPFRYDLLIDTSNIQLYVYCFEQFRIAHHWHWICLRLKKALGIGKL